MNFCWFHMFLFYDLSFEFHSLNALNIYCSTIHLYIHYDLLLQQHFYSHLLLFYVHYCRLPKMNTSLASSQQILQSQRLWFHLLFFQWLFAWIIIVFWLSRIVTKIKHFFIAVKIFVDIFSFNFYIKLSVPENSSFDLLSYLFCNVVIMEFVH